MYNPGSTIKFTEALEPALDSLAEIAHRLKPKALEELKAVAKPDTLLAWYRRLIANKFDGSKFRKS